MSQEEKYLLAAELAREMKEKFSASAPDLFQQWLDGIREIGDHTETKGDAYHSAVARIEEMLKDYPELLARFQIFARPGASQSG